MRGALGSGAVRAARRRGQMGRRQCLVFVAAAAVCMLCCEVDVKGKKARALARWSPAGELTKKALQSPTSSFGAAARSFVRRARR
jgi:hypothetical protein